MGTGYSPPSPDIVDVFLNYGDTAVNPYVVEPGPSSWIQCDTTIGDVEISLNFSGQFVPNQSIDLSNFAGANNISINSGAITFGPNQTAQVRWSQVYGWQLLNGGGGGGGITAVEVNAGGGFTGVANFADSSTIAVVQGPAKTLTFHTPPPVPPIGASLICDVTNGWIRECNPVGGALSGQIGTIVPTANGGIALYRLTSSTFSICVASTTDIYIGTYDSSAHTITVAHHIATATRAWGNPAFDPTGTFVWVTDYGTNTVTPYNVSTGTPGSALTVATAYGCGINANGTVLAAQADGINQMDIFSLPGGSAGTPLSVSAINPIFMADQVHIFTIDPGTANFKIVDIYGTGGAAGTITGAASLRGSCISPDGLTAYCTDSTVGKFFPISLPDGIPLPGISYTGSNLPVDVEGMAIA